MDTPPIQGKTYQVDDQGFLQDWEAWDEAFAEATAPEVGIPGGLTERHWDVIQFIRYQFQKTGECPLVFTTCRTFRLHLRDLETLFPAGYLRGACRLAGIDYRDRFVDFFGESARQGKKRILEQGKVYRVDAFGFLVDPSEWDESYATNKAQEMKLPGGLSEKHWQILLHLQEEFGRTGVVPTVIECCKAIGIELDELEILFPDGYQRGAVKLAGLCLRLGKGGGVHV
ncbi:MAG: TusE/DsrC/DsvC family sulfur relay protein [Longimicrobiales bacterium]|nr:TusE/DsrC/DsvC family sulfur relay protein [Longimicrobiales bacterium]